MMRWRYAVFHWEKANIREKESHNKTLPQHTQFKQMGHYQASAELDDELIF